MADPTVNWLTGVISIPKSYLTTIQVAPTEIMQIDTDQFRLKLRDLEDDADGRPWPKTHLHNTTVVVGGVTLARVIEILEPYTITFEDGQYAVNLVGSNSNIGDRVNVNQVSVRSANSAGLVDLDVLLASAYQGRVVIDTALGQSGTSEPIGTFKSPSDNTTDAITIANNNGVNELYLNRSHTFSTNDLSAGFRIVGGSPFFLMTADPSADLTNCSMENLSIVGELDGINVITRCSLQAVTDVSGFIEKTAFTSSVELSGNVYIYECYSQVEGLGFFEIRPLSHNIVMRDFHGSVKISNMTGGTHSIEINGGRLVLDTATCTGGTIYARGKPFEIVGADGAGTVVVEQFDRGLSTDQDAKLSDIHGQTSRSVYVDTELGANGNGYQQSPYNNWTSAVDYAEANGLKKLTALADAVVDRQLKNFEVSGVGVPSIDLNGQIMDGSIFERCKLTGSYTGTIQATECAVVNLSGMQGVFLTVSAAGTLSPLPGGSLLISRVAPAISAQAWTLNMNSGVASIVAVHNSSGEVIVTNMDHAGDTFHFHATNGELIIDSTCTAGNIVVSGTVKVIDNSVGAIVNISAVSSEITLDAIA